MNAFDQRMTNCELFTIANADCLVMKKIGYRPITEADALFVDLSITINPFLTKPYENFILKFQEI